MESTEISPVEEPLIQEGKFKTKPYKHQIECLNKHGRRKAFALLAEMGTGKTWIVINNFADLWSSGDCDGVLVFAPNGVHSNWTRLELPAHAPDWLRWKAVAWSPAATKSYRAELEKLYEDPFSGELRILTMNWEALQTKRGFEEAQRFANCCSKLMIVCDESDAIKNPSAARTKALMKLKKYSFSRRIMSGTPINNSPFDLFSQFNFLDEQILKTTSFFAFKAEYAEILSANNPLVESIRKRSGSNFSPQIVAKGPNGRPKYRNLDKLSALIEPHSFRVLKKECLDLPEKIYKTLVFELTAEQRAVYEKAKRECRLVFENDEIAFNKLVAVTKLTQITSGYFIHPSSHDAVKILGENPKLELLSERVASAIGSGAKVIIWARYRAQIEDIVEKLKNTDAVVVEYHGGINAEDRVAAIKQFQNGDANVFVGNQQAGGTGITLTAASFVIYFSNNFSLRDRLQSEDRAHRIGQRNNVVYINMIAKNTIDEAIVKTLLSKKDVAEAIVDRGLRFLDD